MGWTIGIPSLKLNNVGQKSKHCGSFSGVAMEALEERKGRDPDINPELSHLNIYEGFSSAKALMEYSKAHVDELTAQQRAEGKRGIRADAVVMCSTIFKPPAEMMATMSHTDQVRFLRDAQKILQELIGPERCRATAYHFDEQGGHLHQFWEPMTDDGRLCAKELHNIKFFGLVNQEMPKRLRDKGWDIDDCNCYDAAKEELLTDEERKEQLRKNGRSSAVYKRDQERQAKRLKEQTVALKKQVNGLEVQLQAQYRKYEELCDVNKENLKIIDENRNIIQQQTEILGLIRDYDEYRAEVLEVNKDIDSLEEIATEMTAKKFPPKGWPELVKSLFEAIRKVIDAGLKRLRVFEVRYKVEEKLSIPAENRVKSLEQKIFGADKRKGAGLGQKETNYGDSTGGGDAGGGFGGR